MLRVQAYTDDELILAVKTSFSWREVYSRLGLTPTSSASTKAKIRKRIRELNVNDEHFARNHGPIPRWSEEELREAVRTSSSLREVVSKLKSSYHAVKYGIERYKISVDHFNLGLNRNVRLENTIQHNVLDLSRLQFAAQSIAQAWFQLRSYIVTLPLQPVSYDFLAVENEIVLKVQVKSTRQLSQGSPRFIVNLTCSNGRGKARTYTKDEVDIFFVIASNLKMYFIPYEVVDGVRSLVLDNRYKEFEVQWT
jgi:hypothetical protein